MQISDFCRGEGFSSMLFRFIEDKGLTDVEAYKKANVSRQLFSKIRSDSSYHPSKRTVLKFALALELSLEETELLLLSAGFAFVRADMTDWVVKCHIISKRYDIYSVNETFYKLGLRIFRL